MATSTGELRELLVAAIEAVRDGGLKPEQAKAIAALAGQVHLSLQVELNVRQFLKGESAIGSLPIGETENNLPAGITRITKHVLEG